METNDRSSQPCDCKREGHIAEYRCLDCGPVVVRCHSCIRDCHRHLFLHRIERWDHPRFLTSNLFDLGLKLYLGHNGEPCPNLSEVDASPLKTTTSAAMAPVDTPKRPDKRSSEKIFVTHVHGMCPVAIRYCQCPLHLSHVCQLLRAGLVPGSPERPESAFHVDLLGLYHTLNMESGLNMYDFYKTMVRRTNNAFRKDVPVRTRAFHAHLTY